MQQHERVVKVPKIIIDSAAGFVGRNLSHGGSQGKSSYLNFLNLGQAKVVVGSPHPEITARLRPWPDYWRMHQIGGKSCHTMGHTSTDRARNYVDCQRVNIERLGGSVASYTLHGAVRDPSHRTRSRSDKDIGY
jgi:hypothetical protein